MKFGQLFKKIILLGSGFLVLFFWLGVGADFSEADSIQINLEITSGGGGGGSGGGTGGGGGGELPPKTITGCVDPAAINYNSQATVDDGSCQYPSTPVPNVSDFIAIFNRSQNYVELFWSNPNFSDFDQVRIMRRINSIPVDENDGALIYQGTGEFAIDNQLFSIGSYFYVALVRDKNGHYSSGSVASIIISEAKIVIPPVDEEISSTEDGETAVHESGADDPFANFPEATLVDPQIGRLTLADFIFSQVGEPTQFFGRQRRIRLNGRKNFTISLAYEKVPAVLKIIGVAIYDPTDPTKVFSFLMRVNKDRTQYQAMIGSLPKDGLYPINIYILNFNDQTLKRIAGTISVTGVLKAPESFSAVMIKRVLAPAAVGGGVVAGVVAKTVILTSGARTLVDFYLLFLRGLGALLGFFGLRRRHKPWGTVYDSVTKRPIDPAYVSVHPIDHEDKEIASAITDIDGRYGFFLAPGIYKIKVGKTHYDFPSKKLLGQNHDQLYDNLYFGEPIETSGQEVINKNIPLDPIGFDWNEFIKGQSEFFKVYSQKEARRARIFNTVYNFGFVVALISFVLTPSILSLVMLLIYLALFIFSLVWQRRHKVVTIKWEKRAEPIPFAIIRLFLADLNQEVKQVVADALGRFYVLVRPGVYYFTVEEKQADGSYRKIYQSSPIDLKKGVFKNDLVVKENNLLSPLASDQSENSESPNRPSPAETTLAATPVNDQLAG